MSDLIERLEQSAIQRANSEYGTPPKETYLEWEAAARIRELEVELAVAKKFMDRDAEDYNALKAEHDAIEAETIEKCAAHLDLLADQAASRGQVTWYGHAAQDIRALAKPKDSPDSSR